MGGKDYEYEGRLARYKYQKIENRQDCNIKSTYYVARASLVTSLPICSRNGREPRVRLLVGLGD